MEDDSELNWEMFQKTHLPRRKIDNPIAPLARKFRANGESYLELACC